MATYERGGDALRAGDVVAGLFGGRGTRALSAAQLAARSWYAVNGDRERAHTTGVWLKSSGKAHADPVLTVAVDAHWLAVELGTNKDLYLQRLAMRGIRVSDIRFTVSAPRQEDRGMRKVPRQAHKPLAPLAAEDEARVQRAVCTLPDGLRDAAARAMRASLQRGRRTGKETK